MSLYGALFSGVSGLTAQSSAMGAISDNITNVSTIGYKGTTTNFQTLVTKQTSSTFYSAGGVQSKPRQQTDVQGLLQSSTSQTDISMSGAGFFVVNQAPVPGISDPYLYTRAGSFIQDDQGFLKNAQGYYVQGWPTDPAGTVIPANTNLTVPNQNVISSDYLESINLNRVGGTAAATNTVAIGANLPSSDVAGTSHKTDVQFFDSLGNANNLSINYTKSTTGNQWNVGIAPPPGTAVSTLYDNSGNVYSSSGLVEFTAIPAAGSTIKIGFGSATATTYTFVNGAPTGNQIQVDGGKTLSQVVAALVAKVQSADQAFAVQSNRIEVKPGVSTAIQFNEGGVGEIYVDLSATLNSTGGAVTNQTGSFTVKQTDNAYSNYTMLRFDPANLPANGDTISIRGTTYTFQSAEPASDGDTVITTSTFGAMMADLENSIEANDSVLAVTGNRVKQFDLDNNGTNDTLYIETVANVTDNIDTSGMTAASRPKDGDLTAYASTTIPVATASGIVFSADGLPSTFNVKDLELLGFANGAQNMNNATNEGKRITFDFGTVGQANGLTQFGAEFTPNFITQNGSKFGTFSGVTIGTDGLVTALFDNGETRKIFKIPVATFTNPNQMSSQTGNVWTATQNSGDYTLRNAGSGAAGQIIQSALEASTVDIGAEFTSMIVVQRAYSASTKIISTADQMLQELMNVKR
ncbi:flagellar hook-basal body complex protein [Varunaivibrio sulfuroxidans]|uniref:Flagellar hook protein FlgE n=1 Tax=Varunaivibrio sulfuroxidans TaxID=1773489 RepID=A0A4R3J854_9PROT|nr:flagellar hook-basal body complex protein [Varunaivibrio sulfuroxidans]TCS62139.1 flagellar hook protein FlgE [Varunaivibrio sulfuroxidans]WES30570.1 flagellar hook-basal body complex protein [Varunaivibrio sulfuroxidans]